MDLQTILRLLSAPLTFHSMQKVFLKGWTMVIDFLVFQEQLMMVMELMLSEETPQEILLE
jgi:hypothetical protein